ncbi:MAG TPA: GDP-mannose 4,6-dehydratase [Candidatus Thermoplasmatota archaeon]
MAEKVLVTGATGFIGAHLIEHLGTSRPGARVTGTSRAADPAHNRRAARAKAELVALDMRKRASVERVVRKVRPDCIFHLAAQSLPTTSWEDPWYTLETNVVGTASLFEAVRSARLDPRIFVACSSAEYGLVPAGEVPVREERELKPLHPYGVSKVAQDLLAYQYFANYGTKVIRGRIFNTTGPRKTGDVLSDWTRRTVELERRGGGRLRVGNLKVMRDIADVRDQVRAFDRSVDELKYGEAYNFARSSPYRVSDLLEVLVGKARVPVRPTVDKKLLRPTDEPVIWGDSTKMRRALGFKYAIPIEKTIEDMLRFWRASG